MDGEGFDSQNQFSIENNTDLEGSKNMDLDFGDDVLCEIHDKNHDEVGGQEEASSIATRKTKETTISVNNSTQASQVMAADLVQQQQPNYQNLHIVDQDSFGFGLAQDYTNQHSYSHQILPSMQDNFRSYSINGYPELSGSPIIPYNQPLILKYTSFQEWHEEYTFEKTNLRQVTAIAALKPPEQPLLFNPKEIGFSSLQNLEALMAASSAYEGGGVGGKYQRRKQSRRPTLPYERPPSAIRTVKDVFVAKVVDPASRIIAKSAQHLFSSLFRKKLTAPPLVSEATPESRDGVQQANTASLGLQPDEQVGSERENQSCGSGNDEINEIEKVLKQKTFTRAEIDHLTELLQSRTVTGPAENDQRISEPTSHREAVHGFPGHANFPVQGNNLVLASDVTSAAELAKAHMGNVPSNVSSSTIAMRSQILKKEAPLLTNVPYTPMSSGLSLAKYTPKSSGLPLAPRSVASVSENSYTVRSSRGRSAIYNMARTPNSRVQDPNTGKTNGNLASSSSQWSLENNTLSSGKQALKRRSSVLDSDIGSIGPIRRIRRKTDMMSPSKNLISPSSGSHFSIYGNADHSEQGSRSLRQKQMFRNGPKNNISNIRPAENDDNSMPDSMSIPSQSSEMAEKIFQQLDKLDPPPKEKLSELKLAVAREKSPTKLSRNMLHEKALRIFEDVDSSKLLQNAIIDGVDGLKSRAAQDSSSHKQDKFDNSDPMQIAASNKFVPKEKGVETKTSKENVSSVEISNSAIFSFVEHPSQKKQAFRMSAQEDFLDLDDDSDNGGGSLATEKGKVDASAVYNKDSAAGKGITENHSIPSSETKSQSSILKDGMNNQINSVSTTAEKKVSFALPAPTSSTSTQVVSPAPQVPLFANGSVPPKESSAAPIFSFGSKNVDKAPPFEFSPKFSGVNESLNPGFGAQSESKLTQSSAASVADTVTDAPKVSKSEDGDSHKSSNFFSPPGNIVSSSVSTSATMTVLSSGLSTTSPKNDNGPVSISSHFPISSAHVSNGSSEVIFSAATTTTTIAAISNSTSASVTATGNSTSTPVTTTSSNQSLAVETTTPSTVSMFKFGSTSPLIPSNSALLPSSTSGTELKNSEVKEMTSSSFGNLTKSPFGASSSSEFTSMGGSIFGLSASVTSCTSNLGLSSSNQSLSSNPFGTAGGFIFGGQRTSTETKTEPAPLANSLPNPFGVSAPSSTVGQSAASSFSSSSSPFGSASTAPNVFGSSTGFGVTSQTSMDANPFTPSSGASLFSSSLSSGTSSVFGSGFGSTTSKTGFSFGASSAAASSAPSIFGPSVGSSAAPVFSFSQTAATTSVSHVPSQSIFGTSSPVVQFGSDHRSNDQMNMEDSMAEDTIQASNPMVPSFGQPANSPPPGNYVFGSVAPSGGSPFQFGGQQNLGTPPNPSPFQAPGSLEFSTGGSFSLGTGGGDKANRRIVKIKRDKLRKRRMLFDKVEPNYITFVSLLNSCVELYDVRSGKQLHCFITKSLFSNNHVVSSVLIDLYGKCGLVEEARRLFDTTLSKDLVLWNVMVSCYTLNGLGKESLGIFELLRSDGFKGDDFTFSSLLCSCGMIGFGDVGKQIHGLIIRLSFDMDILVSSALIDMYVKTDNLLDAHKIFDGMTARNVVSWTTMVVGYGRQGDGKEAMQLFKGMLRGYLSPDELTIASILSSCAHIAAINEIGQVHAHAAKKGLESFLSIGNALINAYSKCGSLAGALKSFNSIDEPNLITWTSIIGAYAFHGLPRRAIEVFEEMLSKGAKPDRLAVLEVLSACSHGGLVSEGFHYFGSMTKDHQLVPSLEHYACLIDLLGRAGHLDRAYDILENMPTEPGAKVLGAFIGACKAHGNIRLAILAAERLFRLEPKDPMSYTLMSNIYAFVGCWIDVARVRKLMRDRCVHKVPGCSWIEIGAKVHTFVSTDISHPQATELYNMLELFGWLLNEGDISAVSSQFENEENLDFG
ncbi:Pentatricopeptide repeat-containing protein [Thalictrum thalictroides]|uniref:Pentatricopeptide repeat-containing protein n=1 Tax=Thalictrum thalictroides TaxID=46969 RepID=A0A7J6X715_THATH|nr:Pentatricopeptide repeat-containing protein [Thalictrum thalictroides]